MAASKAIRYARHVRLAAWCRLNDSARRRNAHTGWPVGIVATRTSFLLLGHAYHRNQCSVMPGVAISGLSYHRDGKRASEFRGSFLKKSLDKLPNAGILTQVSQCIVRYVLLHDRYSTVKVLLRAKSLCAVSLSYTVNFDTLPLIRINLGTINIHWKCTEI